MFSVWCSLLLFVASQAPQRSEQQFLLPQDIVLQPALCEALAAVIVEQEEHYAAGLRWRHLDPDDVRAASHIFAPLGTDFGPVFQGRTIDAGLASELLLYRRGYLAFREARAQAPTLSPEDLRALLDERFLRAAPVIKARGWEAATAELRRDERIPDETISELGNLAGRFLLWGALTDAEFWAEQEDVEARTEFLAFLISQGSQSALLADVVWAAIAPPARDPRKPAEIPSRTIAGSFHELRDRVGFTAEHLELVEAILEGVSNERSAGVDPFASKAEVDAEEGTVRRQIPSDAFLPGWAAKVRALIASELGGPDAPRNVHSRDGTLEEQLSYWETQFALLPFAELRFQAREHFRALFNGQSGHPNDARIQTLRALAASRGVSDESEIHASGAGLQPDEWQEWQELWAQRDREGLTVARRLAALLADKGLADGDRVGAIEALAKDLPDVLAGAGKDHIAPQILKDGWAHLSRDPHDAVELLEGRRLGDPSAALIPDYGVVALIQNCAIFGMRASDRQAVEALAYVAGSGSASERAAALANPEIFGRRAEGLFEKALNDLGSAQLSDTELRRLRSGFINGLKGPRDAPPAEWTRRLLVKSFEAEQWAGNDPLDWLSPDPQIQAWAVNSLTAEEFARLRAGGKIPQSVAELRR